MIPKTQWIKNKEPQVYAKAYKFIIGVTYIIAKLAGNDVVDWFRGTPVSMPAITMGACFGDAMMAAQVVKYPGFESYDALTNYIQEGTVYQPDMEKHKVYLKCWKIYDALYPVTAELIHDLSR